MKTRLCLFLCMLIPVSSIVLKGQGIIIPSSSYVIQSGGNMIIDGNWVNNGTFTPAAGTISFAGTTDTIKGTQLQTFNNVTVYSPSTVVIPALLNVTVNDTLTNNTGNTGLILQSNYLGSASLLHNTAGVGATFERDMVANEWHIISCPVAGQSFQGFLTNTANYIPTSGIDYGMMYYSEPGGGWVYYTNPASGNLSVGSGYLLRNTVDTFVSMQGTLDAANTLVDITKIDNGWNCIGNPFPCSIGVNSSATTSDNFLTYNSSQLDPSFAALYLWVPPAVQVAGVSYYQIICNAGFVSTTGRTILNQDYMQPGQGFIVKSQPGGGTVTFTDNMRLHQNTGSYFKSAKEPWSGINLIMSSATESASTAIALHEKMTTGLDVTYDIGLFGGNPAFQIYSRLVKDNGENFMLQCLPDAGFDTMRVPIGVNYPKGGTVTFSAEIVPLPVGITAILIDSLLGTSTELVDSSSTYTAVIATNTSGTGRFFLNISNSASEVSTDMPGNIILKNPLDIFYDGKDIIVKGIINNNNTKANLYDMSGRLLREYILQPADINILQADGLSSGIYILKVFGDGVLQNQKMFLE